MLFQHFSVFNWRVVDEIKGFTVSRSVLTADCRWQCRHVIHINNPSDSLLTCCRFACKNLSNDSLFSGACVTKTGRETENGQFSYFFLSFLFSKISSLVSVDSYPGPEGQQSGEEKKGGHRIVVFVRPALSILTAVINQQK